MPDGPPKGIVHSAVQDFRVETVAKVGTPYSFDFLPDGRILIIEIQGALRIVDHGKLLPEPVAGSPVGDMTGMTQWMRRANMSIAVHPNYKTNGWVYLLTARHAAKPAPTGAPDIATIWRGRLVGNRWLDNRKILEFPIEATDSLRMKFDKQGYLYVGNRVGTHEYTGVDAEKTPAQDLEQPGGQDPADQGRRQRPARQSLRQHARRLSLYLELRPSRAFGPDLRRQWRAVERRGRPARRRRAEPRPQGP